MMTFLALASKARWPVASFRDRAVAHLGKNARGQMSVTRVDLHPEVLFDAGFSVETVELEKMQHRAHRYCFIANTLADSVEINIL
jgi:organic hydroperoxide reductase OsmC/OhrA